MSRNWAIAAGLAALVAGPAAGAPLQACDVKLNVTDQDPAGLNVRAAPGGQVIAALKAKNRWVQVHVTGQSGAWAAIDGATFISEDNARGTPVFNGHGFVAFSKLGINELDTQTVIYAAPSEGADVLLRISEGDESKLPAAEVLGCDGTFLKVRVSGLVGWTRDFCSNEFTTCV